MKFIKKITITFIIIICLFSLYANFVHHKIFTARKELVKPGTSFLQKGNTRFI